MENENEEINEMLEQAETIQIFNQLNNDSNKSSKPVKDSKSKELHYLDSKKSEYFINAIQNLKHKTAVLLMMDCGLRVTECCTIRIKDFDFKKRIITVKSLKKRNENHFRIIPISQRLFNVLADYLKERKPQTNDDYLFQSADKKAHMSRKAMNRFCERFREKNTQFRNLHPHTLRHTFATQLLNNGAELHHVKEMLGHKSYNTTLIYNHTPIELLTKHVNNATSKKENKIISFVKRILGMNKQKRMFINLNTNNNDFIIGREKELLQILDCINKNVNCVIVGTIGIGKSHLLKQIDLQNKKILMIDELTNLKLTFVNVLLYLYDNDKEAIKNLIFPDFDKTQIKQKLQKDSVYNLIEEIIRITEKHEYVLIIDNVDGITSKGVKCIELLKDHFTIITTTRNILLNKSSFAWNFENIQLKELSRQESIELIHKLSYDLEIEDYEVYRQHIYEQSNGNPRIIYEMCERYRKEIVLNDEAIRSIKHIGGMQEIDMSWSVMLLLACVALLRYTSREVGSESLKFIGGIAMILLMFVRFFLSKAKRKFL